MIQVRDHSDHGTSLGCVPFGESKNGFLIRDLLDFAVERNWICNLGNLSQTRVICMIASKEKKRFLLFDKLCDYTVQNFMVGSANRND